MVSLDNAARGASNAGVNWHTMANGHVNKPGEKPLDLTVLGMNSGTSMVGKVMS